MDSIFNGEHKFEAHLASQSNVWSVRLHLQKLRQHNTESVDNFIARCRLQTQKCSARDDEEFDNKHSLCRMISRNTS